MKVVCVSGGSYKSNYLKIIKSHLKCDLLIFNAGIIYEYDESKELLGFGLVIKELIQLSNLLNSVVAALSYRKGKEVFLVAQKDMFFIENIYTGVAFSYKKKDFIIGKEKTNYKHANKIVLTNKRLTVNVDSCSKNKTYIFCDNKGVTVIKNKKSQRKFNKCSKIILK